MIYTDPIMIVWFQFLSFDDWWLENLRDKFYIKNHAFIRGINQKFYKNFKIH